MNFVLKMLVARYGPQVAKRMWEAIKAEKAKSDERKDRNRGEGWG